MAPPAMLGMALPLMCHRLLNRLFQSFLARLTKAIPTMKRIVPSALLLLLIGCSSRHEGHDTKGKPGDDPHAAHDMKQGVSKLMVQTDPAQAVAGKPTTLKLMIHKQRRWPR